MEQVGPVEGLLFCLAIGVE